MKARKNYNDGTVSMRMDYKDLCALHHGLYETLREIREELKELTDVEETKSEGRVEFKERELKRVGEQFDYVGKMFDWAIEHED